jgi:hypothetical protein
MPMQKPVPEWFRIARPTRAERRALPIAAMAYWDVEGWGSWLIDGARQTHSTDRAERTSAFAPLTRHPDLDGPKELLNELKVAVPSAALLRMEDGLAQCIAGWSWEDGIEGICFLIELTGHVAGSGPRAALRSMLLKPHNFAALKGADKVADSIAFVLCGRAASATIRNLMPLLEPLLATSPAAAILVAARQASDNPEGFVVQLRYLARGMLELPAEARLWRFAVNKLIERAGVDGAVKAAHVQGNADAARLKEALILYRLDFPAELPGRAASYIVRDWLLDSDHRMQEFEAKPSKSARPRLKDIIDVREVQRLMERMDETMIQDGLGSILPELSGDISFTQDEVSTNHPATGTIQ